MCSSDLREMQQLKDMLNGMSGKAKSAPQPAKPVQAAPQPNSQLGQNLATPGWNCHHDNFKDSNPNIEWKATLEQAEKVGMGTRAYTLKKV